MSKKIPIALQLYSVRNECAKDLPGVLTSLSKMGYAGVEFAGYYNRTGKELRKLLDDNHLLCAGTHTKLETLSDENFAATVEFNQEIGNKYLIVPWMPDEMLNTAEVCKKTADLLTKIAAKAKPHGMFVGYHAHGGDFKKIDGQSRWDILFAAAGPDVVMQMDVGNCIDGGGDPYASMKKFPTRSRTVHLKEHGNKPDAAIGEGLVNWPEVFQIIESAGKTDWYIVEHEAGDPMERVKKCLENLKSMGK